jgi:hypothetical protein
VFSIILLSDGREKYSNLSLMSYLYFFLSISLVFTANAFMSSAKWRGGLALTAKSKVEQMVLDLPLLKDPGGYEKIVMDAFKSKTANIVAEVDIIKWYIAHADSSKGRVSVELYYSEFTDSDAK